MVQTEMINDPSRMKQASGDVQVAASPMQQRSVASRVPKNSTSSQSGVKRPVTNVSGNSQKIQPNIPQTGMVNSSPYASKGKKNLWWLWLLIGLIVGAGLASFYFLFFS